MENNGHTFKPGDVLAPKDYWRDGNVVIVVVEASRWIHDIPVYTILANWETSSVDFELTDIDETRLSKHYFREGHINIANYNRDDLKDILEAILKKFPCNENEYKSDAILRTWKDPEFEKHSKPKGEEKMNNAFYKIGDILEFPDEKETYAVLRLSMRGYDYEKVRGLILGISNVGFDTYVYEFIIKTESSELYYQRNAHQRQICTLAKRIGHADISMLEFKDGGDPNMPFSELVNFGLVAKGLDLNKENKELKAEIEKLKKENDEKKRLLDEGSDQINSLLETMCAKEKEIHELKIGNKLLKEKLTDSAKAVEDCCHDLKRTAGYMKFNESNPSKD